MPTRHAKPTASRSRTVVSALAAVAVAAALLGCSPAGALSLEPRPTRSATPAPSATTPAPAPTTPAEPLASPTTTTRAETPAPTSDHTALALALPLIDESAEIPAYSRDSFGDGWSDVDWNGCSTRQDVLQRDLVGETLASDGCTVLTGTLAVDPYTGAAIEFAHDRVGGDSQGVQIDHIVSLSAAHRGGAWAWTRDERVAFANDPSTLLAVDGPTNAAKGDRGPAGWMPEDPASWCDYAADYVSIAADYELAVSADDRELLVDVLTACA